jgi:hypothetical protein
MSCHCGAPQREPLLGVFFALKHTIKHMVRETRDRSGPGMVLVILASHRLETASRFSYNIATSKTQK